MVVSLYKYLYWTIARILNIMYNLAINFAKLNISPLMKLKFSHRGHTYLLPESTCKSWELYGCTSMCLKLPDLVTDRNHILIHA